MAAVLFDFSGTLFRIESPGSWLRAVLADSEVSLPEPELIRAAKELEAVGAQPGGAHPSAPVPADVAPIWGIRDQSSELHRSAYTGVSRQVTLPDPALHDRLYDRHMAPAAWRPYPDTAEVLGALRERGVAVGVVSNIGWDLRPVFRSTASTRTSTRTSCRTSTASRSRTPGCSRRPATRSGPIRGTP